MILFFYTIFDGQTGGVVGLISYGRITPVHGVIEIAHVHFSDALKNKSGATEAIYLLLEEAFVNLSYRRCEWKCNALNEPSRKAALRLGFTYEGRFRQDRIFKGHNRDTDWFSIIDSEWSTLSAGLQKWLHPMNFDAAGRQRIRLADMFAHRET